MPKGPKKGGKTRRRQAGRHDEIKATRELPFAEDGCVYARVVRLLGNCRITGRCSDGKERLGILRGIIRKKEWMKVEDYILCSLRDYEDAKMDVLTVLSIDEVKRLKALGEMDWDKQREDDKDDWLNIERRDRDQDDIDKEKDGVSFEDI